MPNQREIARRLGLSQSTVSLALRRAPGVASATRRLVDSTARELGYRPSPMVATLMAHIRAGRQVADQGCVGILVDTEGQGQWLEDPDGPYVRQYQGYRDQAAVRGFRTECFYLRAPGMNARRLDRQLQARGILGLILAAPRKIDAPPLALSWERYACATISYGWRQPVVDRVATDFRHLVETAFATIRQRGGRRIGMCLWPEAVHGVNSNWKAAFLLDQDQLPPRDRIPLFVGKPGLTPPDSFRQWVQRHQPDVLVCHRGQEMQWLHELGLRVPRDIGVVCLNRPAGTTFAGMDENNTAVGAMVCDLVVNRLTRNACGLPERPQTILISGDWVDGESFSGTQTRRRKPKLTSLST